MKCAILALAAALVLAAGCGKKEETTTYKTPEGEVTVKQDGSGSVSVTGTQGQSTVTSKNGSVTSTTTDASGKTSTMSIGSQVDLSQIGVKLYPGATQKAGSSVKTDTPQGVSMGVQLETKDDAVKIVEFYKTELKADNTATTPEGGLVSGTTSAGDKAVVMITKAENGNNISLTVVKKKP